MKRFLLILAAAAAVIAGGVSAAYASIPDSGGVIHACYQSPPPAHGANLQVIDTGAGGSCSGGMTALTWNQTGPQGPAGAQGPAGPAGPAATSSVATRDVHYSSPGGNSRFTDTQTIDCPSGTHAINGGVLQTAADSPWAADAVGAGYAFPGDAVAQQGAEVPNLGTSSHATDPVNPSIPRPVNGNASWRVAFAGDFPFSSAGSNGTQYGITVTLYAVCE